MFWPLLALILAAVPAILFRRNLKLYRAPLVARHSHPEAISVLIPARNEERNIREAIESVLANRDVELEVIVLDDHSQDGTASIVRSLVDSDHRLRLATAPPLPEGWCGKQHACWVLAQLARNPVLCFMDADVRLSPDALGRMGSFRQITGAALVSGFPVERTGSLLEHLLIPLIHFILLGFLPLDRMRSTNQPAYAAGCGQLMMVRRDPYFASGGHSAIRGSLHDGLRLPKAFRSAGYSTDLFDATEIASCRMYTSASEVWGGLAKNASEGLAAPARIIPFSVLLIAGQVLPFILLFSAEGWALTVAGIAALLAWYPRFAAASRFRQPLIGAILHPVGIVLLLAIQWYAFGRSLLGRGPEWKGRAYASVS